MAARRIAHPGLGERGAAGLRARTRAAAPGHPRWRPGAGRPDPVAVLEVQDLTREPDLVPKPAGRR